MSEKKSLLLVTHVHVRQGPNGPQIDDQSAAGLAQWCQHFDSVTYYGIATSGSSSTAWVDLDKGIIGERARVIGLPFGYGPFSMVRAYAKVQRTLRREIAAHRHLCFTLGFMMGDWPLIAAREAIRQKRRFSVKLDRVEGPILQDRAQTLAQRAGVKLLIPAAYATLRHVLSKSTVALLQGADTYDFYASHAPDPHCIYNTHTSVAEQISPIDLAAKQTRVRSGAPLRIVYLGRAAPMKGPFDWLDALHRLQSQNVPFEATWLGDGPNLEAMRQRVAELGLTHHVTLPGFEDRRDVLLAALKDSDVLMFCHKTPESPRCLVESLVCGCPIVGYDTAYPLGLIAQYGGGVFSPQNDPAALAHTIATLHADREGLASLIAQAAQSGTLYNEDAVYAHRANLMKRA